jgi:hypothetical protein
LWEIEMTGMRAERLQRVVYAAEPGLPVDEFRQLLVGFRERVGLARTPHAFILARTQ